MAADSKPVTTTKTGAGADHRRSASMDSKTEKVIEEQVESSLEDLMLERFSLLRDKTVEERKAIEKSLVRKLDWKFLPCITMMLLMKYVLPARPGRQLV
jgi:hypothetical protein